MQIIPVSRKDGSEHEILLDDKDFERLKDYTWFIKNGTNTFYAMRVTIRPEHKLIRMHREILNCPNDMQIDHRDGNGLNNQRSNLRICTVRQNQQNQQPRKGGSSKYKGVHFCKREQKFRAIIVINGKNKSLGYFINEIDAAKAYDAAAIKYFGEFFYING